MSSELEQFIEYSKKAVREVVDYLSTQGTSMTYRESKASYLSSNFDGSYSDKVIYKKEIFFSKLYIENKESINKLTNIINLDEICTELMSKYNKEIIGLIWLSHITLIFDYFSKKKKILYDEQLIESIAHECYKQITSKTINIVLVISLENISSDSSFIINNIIINKITQKQLKVYSSDQDNSFSSMDLWLKDDSWIATITYTVEKKRYREAINSTENVADDFINAVRLSFGQTGIKARLLSKTIKEHYLNNAVIRSTFSINPCGKSNTFYIDKEKKKEIRSLYKLLIKLKEYPDSLNRNIYFALRKYSSSQVRSDLSDSFVDIATGLESLLCADSKSEISYRFRMRGAKILDNSRDPVEYRINIMKDIYNLRSSIVHGDSGKQKLYSVDTGKIEISKRLEFLSPVALLVFSKIIKWYLIESVNNYYPKNKDAISILKDIDLLMANAK